MSHMSPAVARLTGLHAETQLPGSTWGHLDKQIFAYLIRDT